jgi:hypothetical protein
MNTKPVVLLDIGFLAKFYSELTKVFLQIEHHDYVKFLQILLLEKAQVFANIDKDVIIECVLSKREDPVSLLIKAISIGNGQIISLRDDFDFIQIETKRLNKLKPNFILADISSTQAIDINNQTGIIALPSEFYNLNQCMQSLIHSISKVTIEFFDPYNSDINHYIKKDLFDRLFKAKTIYIEDPYLNTVDINYLVNFVQYMFPTNYRCNFLNIFMVFRNSNFNSISEFSQAFDKIFRPISVNFKFIISVTFVNNKSDLRMHDRNILTNSFWISNTNSFHSETSALSNMFVIPIGIYYDTYYKRFKSVKDMIEMSIENNSIITLDYNSAK